MSLTSENGFFLYQDISYGDQVLSIYNKAMQFKNHTRHYDQAFDLFILSFDWCFTPCTQEYST